MSIKVLVALNGAFLPLQTHLSQLPANAHSERLRSLASMGLLIQSGRLQASVAAGHVELPGKDEGALNCRIPDDHMVACGTAADGIGAIPSWPAAGSCS